MSVSKLERYPTKCILLNLTLKELQALKGSRAKLEKRKERKTEFRSKTNKNHFKKRKCSIKRIDKTKFKCYSYDIYSQIAHKYFKLKKVVFSTVFLKNESLSPI